MNITRIYAMVLRHLYLYKRSIPRMMEILYWPTLDLVVWGFITVYLSKYKDNLPQFITFLLGALILWDLFFRAQQGISMAFLEEMWSRNLISLFISPLTLSEYLVATFILSVVKAFGAGIVMVGTAWLFFDFNIFRIGLYLIPFILNLVIFGWSIGIVTTGLILRFGEEAEVLAWGFPFIFQPLSAVFYPLSVFPQPVQYISRLIPASHLFEGMRSVINDGIFPVEQLIYAFSLNIVYIVLAWLFFLHVFRIAKEKGLLVKIGT